MRISDWSSDVCSSDLLGEAVVQGSVNPDEFYVYKPNIRAKKPAILKRGLGEKAKKLIYSADKTIGKTIEFANVSPEERNRFSLSDAEVEALAAQALIIEEPYGRPKDLEWGKTGFDGQPPHRHDRPENGPT